MKLDLQELFSQLNHYCEIEKISFEKNSHE